MSEQKFNWKEEFEKAEAGQKELKEHYQGAIIRMNVELEARAFGMIDPDLAVKLVDLSGCSFDEESDIVMGAREAIEALAAQRPYLFTPKERGVPPPPKREDGFFDAVRRELGFKKS